MLIESRPPILLAPAAVQSPVPQQNCTTVGEGQEISLLLTHRRIDKPTEAGLSFA
jgi:hypothetical protein